MTKKLLPTLFLAVMMTSTAAQADMATLNSNGALSPEGAVQFTLSANVPKSQLNRLFVEFDGYDVTNMVAMDGLTVTFKPPQRLGPGDYRLRILEKNDAGKFTEVENWMLRVEGAGMADASVTGTAGLEYDYLAAGNHHGTAAEDPHQVKGALNGTARTGGPGWDTSLQFNGAYDSMASRNPDGNSFLLGEYLATARSFSDNLNTTWRLGNHDTGVSNILMDKFYRRGASSVFDVDNHVSITGFSQDPARAIGTPNAEGFGESNQRASGFMTRVYPRSLNDKRDFIEAGYYTAEGTLKGNGTAVADNLSNSGDGWVFAAESQTQNDKLNLRGDLASAQFDDDGSGALVTAKSDAAERLRITFAPRGTLKAQNEDQTQWTVTLLGQSIGTDFRSIVNTTLPQDEKRLDASTTYQHKTFVATGEGFATQNNVNDEVDLPTDRAYGAIGQVSLTPADIDSALAPDDWFTYSTFTAGGTIIGQHRDKTPSAFTGISLSQTTWTTNAGWSGTFSDATLSLSQVYSDFSDSIDNANSYNDALSTLAVTYTPTDRFTVTPAVQYDRNDKVTGGLSSKYFLTLDTSSIIIPDKLTHSFHYSTLLDSSATGEDQRNASTTLTWQIKPAAKNDPGVALALSGYYQDIRLPAGAPIIVSPTTGTTTTPGQDTKVYLQLKISSPFGF